MKSLSPTSPHTGGQRGLLDDELERLALQGEARVAQVGHGGAGPAAPPGAYAPAAPPAWRSPGSGPAAVRCSWAGARRDRGPAYLRAGLLDVDPDHPGELAGERLDLGPVADRGDQLGGLAQRVDAAVGPVEVVAGDHVGEHEAVERDPAGDQLAHRGVAGLEPQVAGVEAVGLDRDVGLADEVLVAVERPQRGLLAGLVAVEGEDDLAAELVVVVQQPAQHPAVLLAEGGAAGRDRGRHAGEVAGHHVGVALDDDRLAGARDLAAGQVDAVEHLALLVDRGLGGVEVLRLDPVVVEDPARTEADRLAGGLADRPEQPAAEPVVVAALALRDEPGGDQLPSVNRFCRRCL